MAKKGTQGESPTERAIDLMQKFIKRSESKQKRSNVISGRRKDPNIPIHMWPLKDQLEYWDDMSYEDRFARKWGDYQTWLTAIREKSGMYHITFRDCISKHKEQLRKLHSDCIIPRKAVQILRDADIIH